jgi:hypothetical protein
MTSAFLLMPEYRRTRVADGKRLSPDRLYQMSAAAIF